MAEADAMPVKLVQPLHASFFHRNTVVKPALNAFIHKDFFCYDGLYIYI
jgi:hypothetical protein